MQVMTNMQRIIVNEVRLDTDAQKGGDIYLEKSSGNYAITKVGCMKLAAAANISIVRSESVQPDVCIKCINMTRATGRAQPCGNCPHGYDVKYIVTIRVPEPSGGFRLIAKDKEIDCAMEKQGMTDQQYKRFLPHKASIAESKALVRCIRDALGLKAGYTLDELKKPFIVAHIVPNLDAPEIRNALASGYLQSMGLLFETPSEQKALPASAATSAPAKSEPPALPKADDNYDESEDPPDTGDDNGPLPWDKPQNGIWCEDCGAEITAVKAKNGSTLGAGEIKDFSVKKFGRCLCPACQKNASKEKF
jgi:hypothetical protein